MSEYYLIAEIKSVYSADGYLSLIAYSDRPERFFELKYVYVDIFGQMKKFLVENVIEQKGYFTLKFLNFNTQEEVEIFVGKKLYVDEENLIPLSEDTYFVHDLLGSTVVSNGEKIGIVTDVLNLPANDVYVIKDLSDKEILVPAIHEYIESFDARNKLLVLRPGKDIYESENED